MYLVKLFEHLYIEILVKLQFVIFFLCFLSVVFFIEHSERDEEVLLPPTTGQELKHRES